MTKFEPDWLTIPLFAHVKPENPYHKEQKPRALREFPAKNLHVLARAEMEVPGDKRRYILRISADDRYMLWINGIYAGQGPAPAWPEKYYFNEIDITGYLHPGKNVLAVHLYYQGLVNRVWNSGDGRFALAAQVTAETETAESVEGHTEGCIKEQIPLIWKYQIAEAYSGETTGYETQFLEDFDSRCWEQGWNQTDFDDSVWEPMVKARWADYKLIKQPTEMLAMYERAPKTVEKAEGCWFVDIGREITGSLRVKALGPWGAAVEVLCGEEKNDDGSVRYAMRCGCCYREKWTLDGNICELEPYDYKGFRYAEIHFGSGVKILDVSVLVRHYPMDDSLCRLRTTDEKLAGIFHICRNTVKYSTQEAYLDCPTREKGQYLGDAVVTSRSQVWLTGKTDMLRKCIDQFALTKSVCPGLLAVAPGAFMQEIADFSLLWSQLLMTDYEFTGDKGFLSSYYDTAKGIVSYFAGFQNEKGLLDQVWDKWNLVDWPENLRDDYDFNLNRPVVAEGCHNVVNALYAGAVKTLTEIETILELPVTYSFSRIKASYVKAFYRPDKKQFADSVQSTHCSLHSNLYALYFGLVPDEAVEHVADLLEEKGFCCGVMPSYFLLKALAGAGHHEGVYRLLTNEGEHGWVNMLREGATTCFEAWGKDQKWNTSLCHTWATAPVSIVIEELAGIHPDPGEEKGFRFEPHIPDSVGQFHLTVPYGGKRFQVVKEEGDDRTLLCILPEL